MPSAAPDIADLPDTALAQRVVAGDGTAFEQLMRRYNQPLYRTARSILKDDAEAEDALQEAWLQIYRVIGGFRGEARLLTWLTRIVANEALARLRKHKRRAEIIPIAGDALQDVLTEEDQMFTHAADTAEPPEAGMLRDELRRLIERRIDGLPDAFRTVFVLRELEEMTVEEVAASLGIPPATVRTRYFRAKGLLREALASEIDFNLENAFTFAGERCGRIVAGVLARLGHPLPGTGPLSPTERRHV
ncbi:MAG: RNA polymerase subunit sigma [Nevskiales bacterium]|nr:RNA polymerase subunit sigma [Nevskiales bacterium]